LLNSAGRLPWSLVGHEGAAEFMRSRWLGMARTWGVPDIGKDVAHQLRTKEELAGNSWRAKAVGRRGIGLRDDLRVGEQADAAVDTVISTLGQIVARLDPERLADAALWVVSDEASVVTGVELPVDAEHLLLPGYYYYSPRL
jgi:hypothetical protein